MASTTSVDVSGLEFDWLASDADEHVALFSTAGGGFAPLPFLLNPHAHQAALDELLAAPASTAARFAPHFPAARQNTWRLVAERGLYAFDSDIHGGPYRLVAAPLVPASIAELPLVAKTVVGSIRLQHLRFSQCDAISAELILLRQARE